MNNKELFETVCAQLAIDYNCAPEDFDKNGIIITEAVKLEGRRVLPFRSPRCEVITMGKSVIVNASKDVLPFVKKKLAGKSKYDVINTPFVYGQLRYYLPDAENFKELAAVSGFEYKIAEQSEISDYYRFEGFQNALQYNTESRAPEILAVAVMKGAELAGIAAAVSDSEKMCQIGVDVAPEYRKRGLAASAVNMLTAELLKRGKIPYYFTDNSNFASQKTALAAGYHPAWLHSYKSRLVGKPFAFLNYLKFAAVK